MTKTNPALPITTAVLRILIAANWAFGAAILALLVGMLLRANWTFAALGAPISPETHSLAAGMRLIAALGLVTIPLHYVVLRWLLAIIESVKQGDPFVTENARRLQFIARSLLALQLLSITIGAIANSVTTSAHPLHVDAGFSPEGWVAVLLAFVLAQVFSHGAAMREDLAGTV